ncbi:MAG: OsmC family protein [Ahniella sp.]|nr:OsmC family protein [Ahniella sp.]
MEHRIVASWARGEAAFERGNYGKDHQVTFAGGQQIGASSASSYGGNAALADPEQLLLAALASCHMLTFLAIASNRGFVVESYQDDAVCELGQNPEGQTAVVRAVLTPKVRFSGDKHPDHEQFRQLHERAHKACFIANSVRTKVDLDPVMQNDT